jgi:hypothetical protein
MHPHEHGDHSGHPAAGDEKGFHGRVRWGTDSVYLSHLAMIRVPSRSAGTPVSMVFKNKKL